jgi:hypothetical protein
MLANHRKVDFTSRYTNLRTQSIFVSSRNINVLRESDFPAQVCCIGEKLKSLLTLPFNANFKFSIRALSLSVPFDFTLVAAMNSGKSVEFKFLSSRSLRMDLRHYR